MPKSPFPNYLRTIRKRSGLSQDEVAFLLGSPSGGMVSRYERFNRSPSVDTACGLAKLFGVSVNDLFAGTSEKMIGRMTKQARILEKRLSPDDPLIAQKLNTLRSIGAGIGEVSPRV